MYRYTYAGENPVELPTHNLNTEGKDKDFVYEVSEPINHPDFIEASQEHPAEAPYDALPEAPQHQEQTENIAEAEGESLE